jgi:hypothetical protein
MSSTRAAALIAAVAAVAAGSHVATAAAQEPGARPHSKVVTYDRGDIHVQRLQMSVERTNGRLPAHVALTVQNETQGMLIRELRIGRCTGGTPGAPACPSTRTIRIRLAPGELERVEANVTLRQPPSRPDAIQAALVRPGARQPYAFRSDGLLLLKGTAWRGPGAGQTYGVQFGPGDGARRLSFDIPRTGPDQAYIDVKWTGSAAPTGATTTISRCGAGAGGCTPTTLHAASGRSGPQTFGDASTSARAAPPCSP